MNLDNTRDVTASDKIRQTDVDTLLRLYQLYDGHREALLWFLHEMKDFKEANGVDQNPSFHFSDTQAWLSSLGS